MHTRNLTVYRSSMTIATQIPHHIWTCCMHHLSRRFKKIFSIHGHSVALAHAINVHWKYLHLLKAFLFPLQLLWHSTHCVHSWQHGIHPCENKPVEYALAIYVHSYPNHVLSVWLYIAWMHVAAYPQIKRYNLSHMYKIFMTWACIIAQ